MFVVYTLCGNGFGQPIGAFSGGRQTMNDAKKPRSDKPMPSTQRAAKSKGRIGPEIQNRIGHQLRTMYSDVVNEGVPDRFADLLKQLDQNEPGKEPKK